MSINEDNLTTGAEGFESGATNIDDNLGFDNNNDDDDDDDDDGEGGALVVKMMLKHGIWTTN